MNNFNNSDDREQKGGFWSALTGLFKGGAAAGGAPGMGAAGMGASGGLFATKAGIVGMVLGGATIAAGVGVVYNFMGSSSKPVYSPELFQNSYYEEEAASASQQRAQAKDRSAVSASTLDLFREQAQKDGLGGLEGEGGGEQKAAASTDAQETQASASAAAEAPAADPAAAGPAGGGAAKLAPGAGFGGSSSMRAGSTASAMPRMQGQGGMSGGIGGSFGKMYQPPAGKDGRLGGMTASRAGVKSSPKYAVPVNSNKRGEFNKAKFAGKQGIKAAYSSDASSMRSTAESAFSGETGLTGDVAGGDGGAGLGGAGISQGNALKGNDPNLNTTDYTPPALQNDKPPVDATPWNDLLKKLLIEGVSVFAAIALIKPLGKAAKNGGPYGKLAYIAALVLAAAALVTIGFMVAQGIKLIKGEKGDNNEVDKEGEWAGQTMMGAAVLVVCVKLSAMLADAVAGLEKPNAKTGVDTSKDKTFQVSDSNGNKQFNEDGSPKMKTEHFDSSGNPVDNNGVQIKNGSITSKPFEGLGSYSKLVNSLFSSL